MKTNKKNLNKNDKGISSQIALSISLLLFILLFLNVKIKITPYQPDVELPPPLIDGSFKIWTGS